MPTEITHLHTYFLFPFALDKEALLQDHQALWCKHPHWIDGLDEWIATHQQTGASAIVDKLGPWQRAAYTRFDTDSPAYQDMVFFHPIVRRVFFDTTGGGGESLIRCYAIPLPAGAKVWMEAEDLKSRRASVEVTDLRLFLFANGIGILSIGVEAFGLPASEALWINETLRKVYPSSGRQVREGRAPSRIALSIERDGVKDILLEERSGAGEMRGFQAPLAKTITGLLYFANYQKHEFEPVLDERMIVYTYCAVGPDSFPPGPIGSDAYHIFLSRLLYVDREGADYRYQREFTETEMQRQLYRRWAHQGTHYGFTSYSNITATIGVFDCDEHQLLEGFLVHRMFDTRYYLMAIVALFYRAALLDFAVRTALVSKRLFLDQEDGELTVENIRLANDLRSEFMHFANYWYFGELANKDEEVEHFTMQCREYRVESMKAEIEGEIESLNDSLDSYYHFRSTEAVNRLGILSLIFGAGAVLTGFFGMNFGRDFGKIFFEPDARNLPVHYGAIIVVALLAFGALVFGVYVVAANWTDYRGIVRPRRRDGGSLRRGDG